MFVKLINLTHYLYFMHFNTFFREGAVGFVRRSKGSMAK